MFSWANRTTRPAEACQELCVPIVFLFPPIMHNRCPPVSHAPSPAAGLNYSPDGRKRAGQPAAESCSAPIRRLSVFIRRTSLWVLWSSALRGQADSVKPRRSSKHKHLFLLSVAHHPKGFLKFKSVCRKMQHVTSGNHKLYIKDGCTPWNMTLCLKSLC